MQLVALNSKELMSEKQRTLWVKAAVAYLQSSSLTTISTSRLRAKIRTRDLPNTKQTQQSLTPTLCLTNTAYHIICNTTTTVTYCSVYNLLYNPPHSTPTACRSYLRCLLSGATIDPALTQNVLVWTPASGPGIYIISPVVGQYITTLDCAY